MRRDQVRAAEKWYDSLCDSEDKRPKKERRFVGGPCCVCGKGHDTRDCPSSERR